MEPKNYAAIRSLLKQERGEKVAPHVFKLENIHSLQKYLQQERITYETYREVSENEIRKKASQKDRPVVVISNDKQNKYSDEKSKILTDQILTIDKSRLGDKIGALSSSEIIKLEQALHVVLSLWYCRSGFASESWLLLQRLAKKEGISTNQLLEKMIKRILVGGLLLVLFKNKGQLILDNTPEFLDYCAKSNGLVFFGPIGSGKTAILA
ncbi:2722_t:CDS:2, partial [Dentiscutata erythropus]